MTAPTLRNRAYAKGTHALAECQRCGKRIRYHDLVDDGHVEGLMVCTECWEPFSPLDQPVTARDVEALYRPSPEISFEPDYGIPGGDLSGEGDTPVGLEDLTLASDAAAGATRLVVDEAVSWAQNPTIWVQLNDASYHKSKPVMPDMELMLVIDLLTPLPSGATAGAGIWIGAQGI